MTTKQKPAAKAKAKSKSPKTNGKDHPAPDAAGLAFAKKTFAEYGACDTVRLVTQKFPNLKRGEVIAVCVAVGINKATSATQYQAVKSGAVKVEA